MVNFSIEFIEDDEENTKEVITIQPDLIRVDMLTNLTAQSTTYEFVEIFRKMMLAMGHTAIDQFIDFEGGVLAEDDHRHEDEQEFFKKGDGDGKK